MSKSRSARMNNKLSAKELMCEALTKLNQRSGSRMSDIKKYVKEKHPNVMFLTSQLGNEIIKSTDTPGEF